MSVSQSQIDYEKAHANAYNATGFVPFCIIGIVLITLCTGLRFWSRKIQRTEWRSDDWTLLVALILTIGSVLCYIIMATHYGTGRHFYSLPIGEQVHFLKAQYAFNILYTVGYPLSRISLVLLYRRIFVQKWFRIICWFFVCVYAGYAISTAIADVWLTVPIQAYWDTDITPSKKVDEGKLYLANAFFNIITDCTLLVLPLTVVWRLHMEFWQKLALSWIFALGTLTMIASIVRLTLFFKVDGSDPTFNFTVSSFWTVAEQCLGILCPCLVTFRPLFRPVMQYFTSHLSTSRKSSGIGGATTHISGRSGRSENVAHKRDYKDFHRYIDGGTRASHDDEPDLEEQSVSKLVESSSHDPSSTSPKRSFLPFMGTKPPPNNHHDSALPTSTSMVPPLPNGHAYDRDSTATALPHPPPAVTTSHHKTTSGGGGWRQNLHLGHQPPPPTNTQQDAIALASLDPRNRTDEDDAGFGTTTEAKTVPLQKTPPIPGEGMGDRERGVYPIEVRNEFRLERE